MKRTPVRRHTSLERTAGNFIRKTGLNPASPKRQREAVGRAVVRSVVFERDGWRCVVSRAPNANPCHGGLTVHHLLKASQGGRYEAENLVTLCAHHNDHCEDAPDAAWALGLVIRHGDTHAEAAERRVRAGIGS